MARKLELKVVPLSGGARNGAAPPMFSYGECLVEMLRYEPGSGMSFEEVCKAVEALGPIQKALEATPPAEEVTLTDDQWRTVRDKLQRYRFGLADPAVVDFGRGILDAEELGT
jgi:hypothetical protein